MLALLATAIALAASADAASESTLFSAAAAQAPVAVKYIASGSRDLASVVPGAAEHAGGLAFDSSGNLYVSFENTAFGVEVAVISPDGRLLRRWDVRGGATVGNPTQVAIGPDGLVYVRNRNEQIIRVFTPEGAQVRSFGGSLSPNNVGDLEIDAAGNVYTIDLDRIVKFSAAGAVLATFTPIAGVSDRQVLRGVAVAPDGSLYVTVEPTQGGGVAAELPFLLHLDAAGRRLPDPAPVLHRLLGFRSRPAYAAKDVDFANGRLYIAGAGSQDTAALGVLTPDGRLVDVIHGGQGSQVAVRGERVLLAGFDPNTRLRRSIAQSSRVPIGVLDGVPVYAPEIAGLEGCGGRGNVLTEGGRVPDLVFSRKPSGCRVMVINAGSPCPDSSIPTPRKVRLAGEDITPAVGLAYSTGVDVVFFEIPADVLATGQLVVEWSCVDKRTNQIEVRYEWKGRIDVLIDPSGNVFDARTGRPVVGATVRLQYAPARTGPFGTPTPNAYTPQVNPQTTGRGGFFGWDVALGFWRLRITAFGYRPFTSPVYQVPPERKGLKLRLRPDPRQQAFLVDPQRGRAGAARVGSGLTRKRIAGLRLRVVRGRVRSISVRSGRYRTVEGVRLGTPGDDLLRAYPTTARARVRGVLTSRKPFPYRVAKATFIVRRGRIVAITLGR